MMTMGLWSCEIDDPHPVSQWIRIALYATDFEPTEKVEEDSQRLLDCDPAFISLLDHASAINCPETFDPTNGGQYITPALPPVAPVIPPSVTPYVRSELLLDIDVLTREIFEALNSLRTNPGSYIAYLEDERARFEGDHIGPINSRSKYTHEGPSAWDEAIRALKTAEARGRAGSLEPLEWDDGIALASIEHCNDIGRSGLMSY